MNIFCGNCIDDNNKIPDESVDLGIHNPHFGESDGYNYENWTCEWLNEAKRVLKDTGSMYVFIEHTNLRYLLNAANKLNLNEINHIIWQYNSSVYTKNKFITSHSHILYYNKSNDIQSTFNICCRFGSQKNDDSLLYKDLEDVFAINKKNKNKIPEELIRKLILYSSNPGDLVCDFFMGNFTTAYTALKLGRDIIGYEINENSYDYHMEKLASISSGCDLALIHNVENIAPPNQGKRITKKEKDEIWQDYNNFLAEGLKKSDISKKLQEKYGRGPFSIKNILDDCNENNTR
jgi:site-specific DNA-methyltransferase (adenine-specific)